MQFRRVVAATGIVITAAIFAAPVLAAEDPTPQPAAAVQPIIEKTDIATESAALGEKAVMTSRPAFRTFFAALWTAVGKAYAAVVQIFKDFGKSLEPRPLKQLNSPLDTMDHPPAGD